MRRMGWSIIVLGIALLVIFPPYNFNPWSNHFGVAWIGGRYPWPGDHAWVASFQFFWWAAAIAWLVGALVVGGVLIAMGSNKKSCPKCAERVKEAASVCKHCGHQFG